MPRTPRKFLMFLLWQAVLRKWLSFLLFLLSNVFLSFSCFRKEFHKAGCLHMLLLYTLLQVVINMEWGNFGEMGHLADLQTDYDKQLDAASNNPGNQL